MPMPGVGGIWRSRPGLAALFGRSIHFHFALWTCTAPVERHSVCLLFSHDFSGQASCAAYGRLETAVTRNIVLSTVKRRSQGATDTWAAHPLKSWPIRTAGWSCD